MSTSTPRPTLKALAKRLQVSEATVSLILHQKGRFSEATRQRVLAGAAEFGYRPNGAAQAVAQGRFGSVALLLSAAQRNSRIHDGLLDGIQDGLDAHHLHLLVARLPDERLVDSAAMPKLLSTVASDGLLINYHVRTPPSMEQLIAEFRLPVVWINRKRPVNAVYPDDFVSAKQLTEEMLRLGHRRIAFANLNHHPALSSPDHYSFDDRRDGYCSALSAAGLAPIYVGDEAGEMPFAERLAFAKAWLRNPERPTALIGYNEHATMPFLVAAQALGLTIPSDLSLATFSVNPPDTTGMFMGISQMTFHAIGVAAVDLVVKRIASAGEDQPSQSFAGTYRPGDTVGPPRR